MHNLQSAPKWLTPFINMTKGCVNKSSLFICWFHRNSRSWILQGRMPVFLWPHIYDSLFLMLWLNTSLCIRSTYQVVVEEELVRKVKRELGAQECFPIPTSHGEAQARGAPQYYTAELPPSSLPEATPFTVGDNHTYNGYWNSPLDPRKNYLIYFQAMSNFRGVSVIHIFIILYRSLKS